MKPEDVLSTQVRYTDGQIFYSQAVTCPLERSGCYSGLCNVSRFTML